MRDHSGEPIVVAAKVLGMKADVLQRILLFLNPVVGQSVARVFDLARLYDEITKPAAECMVAIWRHADGRRRAAYEPVHWDGERHSARAALTPVRYRVAQSGEDLPTRTKGSGW